MAVAVNELENGDAEGCDDELVLPVAVIVVSVAVVLTLMKVRWWWQ